MRLKFLYLNSSSCKIVIDLDRKIEDIFFELGLYDCVEVTNYKVGKNCYIGDNLCVNDNKNIIIRLDSDFELGKDIKLYNDQYKEVDLYDRILLLANLKDKSNIQIESDLCNCEIYLIKDKNVNIVISFID